MSKHTAKPIPIRHERPVDFLRIPKTNVVDLRPNLPAGRQERPPRVVARSERRYLVQFIVAAVGIALPVAVFGFWQHASGVKGKVLGASTEAYAALERAADALKEVDLQLAEEEFGKASVSFVSARESIQGFANTFGAFAGVLPQASQVKSGAALFRAGDALTRAAATITGVLVPFLEESSDAKPLATRLQTLPTALGSLSPDLQTADKALKKVKVNDVPEEYRETVRSLKETIPVLASQVDRLIDGLSVFSELIGSKGTLRYLVLFQNNLELRATGGFIGSMALLDVADGRITQLTVPGGGPYDYQSQLAEKLIAPEPLHIVNPHWQLQDANWWPDFPTSAEKVARLYEKSGGPTLDGIIALTPDMLEKILSVTGPIDFTETYGTVFTSENVIAETLLAVDANKERPKQIIADLVPEVLDRLFALPAYEQSKVLAVFDWALREKHLLLYSKSASQQERLSRLGWASEIIQSDKDYLSVIDTNIGGGKTDGVIDETIEHHAAIDDNGGVTVTVTVTRVHRGTTDDPVTGTRNIDFVRFLVPAGSEFVSAEGFERIDKKRFQAPSAEYTIDPDIERIEGRPVVDELSQTRTSNEFGKTVFANWMGVGAGETARASLSYRLPFRLKKRDSYSVYFQKQAGTNGRYVQSTVTAPVGAVLRDAVSTGELSVAGNTTTFATDLNTDQTFGFSLKR